MTCGIKLLLKRGRYQLPPLSHVCICMTPFSFRHFMYSRHGKELQALADDFMSLSMIDSQIDSIRPVVSPVSSISVILYKYNRAS